MKTAYRNKNKHLQGNTEPNMKTLKPSAQYKRKLMYTRIKFVKLGRFKRINGAPGPFVKVKHQRSS